MARRPCRNSPGSSTLSAADAAAGPSSSAPPRRFLSPREPRASTLARPPTSAAAACWPEPGATVTPPPLRPPRTARPSPQHGRLWRAGRLVSALAAASACWGAAAAEAEGPQLARVPVASSGVAMQGEDGELLSTPDSSMVSSGEAADRRKMGCCLNVTKGWMTENPGLLEKTVNEVALRSAAPGASTAYGGSGGGDREQAALEEAALNHITFSMTMSCFRLFDTALSERVLAGEVTPPALMEKLLRSVSEKPLRPTRQQYRLFELLVREEQERMLRQADPFDLPGSYHILGRGMTPSARVAYLSAVLAALSGGAFWAMRRLTREEAARQRGARAASRYAKAEAKLDRKKVS